MPSPFYCLITNSPQSPAPYFGTANEVGKKHQVDFKVLQRVLCIYFLHEISENYHSVWDIIGV
jgi:hypothetical protein